MSPTVPYTCGCHCTYDSGIAPRFCPIHQDGQFNGFTITTLDAEPLPTSSSPAQQALDALAFAHGAIGDAIGLDEGLDGVAGQTVLAMIDAALRANGRLPPDVPPADHAVAPTPYWTASIEPASPPAQQELQRRLTVAISIATNESEGVDTSGLKSELARFALEKIAQQWAYIRDVLIDLQSASSPAWEPIATAPKDGADILGYQRGWCINGGEIQITSWQTNWNTWGISHSGWEPTHWMPLPPPPKEHP